ncbi:MAG: helix-turn-helix domain-containing protein [Halopseudomonas aestusnigri]
MPTRLLNEIQASEILNMAPATLRRWRWAKRGPAFVKMSNRAVRYRQHDIDSYISANIVEAGEE